LIENSSTVSSELLVSKDSQAFHKDSLKAWSYLGLLVVGYIGVYLCRKNLSVAVPLLRESFHSTREEIGRIASAGTLAYAVGKISLGPIIDRFGGRICFLLSLSLVGLFGALGGFAPSITALVFLYSLNRYTGAGAWGSMVKQTPNWFGAKNLALAMGVLSLSYVLGGAAAIALAGQIAFATDQNWKLILGLPSIIIFSLCLLCLIFLPKENLQSPTATNPANKKFEWTLLKRLFALRAFWAICTLSFTLTLMRETFNDWTVDYIRTQAGPHISLQVEAFLSTPFDLCGAAGILFVGAILGRLSDKQRSWMLCSMLFALTVLLICLPMIAKIGLGALVPAIGLVGFLALGPYSLLAGYYSVQIQGPECGATVAGMVDSVGYLSGVLAGSAVGYVLDHGGYAVCFDILASLSFISAFVVFLLKENPRTS
jgi:MFS transporter, OPA family, glycerol-3-phosphate transporter